jgi:ATP-dependent DNA helicase
LNALLDRSPEVFTTRNKGWTKAKDTGAKGDAFTVFEAPADTGNSALANMLGENELPA